MIVRSFAVVGGDKRNIALAENLFRLGHRIKMYGFGGYERETPVQCKNMYETVAGAEYVIGPTPFAHGGVLNAPFHDGTVLVDDLFRLIKPSQKLIAGYIRPETVALAGKYDVEIIDMLSREELLVHNAIPTAEGAIKIAIEETDITLHGNNMLVIGYGRIGTVLSGMLRGMGAKVCAVANSDKSAALAKSSGHKVIRFRDIEAQLRKANVIFNTVPKVLLDRRNMRHIRKDALLVDLASPPYGVDVNDARDFGLKLLFASSLPGKIAPATAATYILETINHIIAEIEAGTGEGGGDNGK